MKKADLEQFRLIVREEIRVEVEPVRDMALSNNQTLHGAGNDPGLVNEVRDIRKKVFLITSGLTTLVTAVINGALYLLGKK